MREQAPFKVSRCLIPAHLLVSPLCYSQAEKDQTRVLWAVRGKVALDTKIMRMRPQAANQAPRGRRRTSPI
ncbi:uncharacterized protein [Bemisia tabaci]|uniref:uncharacterized protein n=1 Tax=Bemisia tabaci TaxID=7038 RepID=UPI003B285E38